MEPSGKILKTRMSASTAIAMHLPRIMVKSDKSIAYSLTSMTCMNISFQQLFNFFQNFFLGGGGGGNEEKKKCVTITLYPGVFGV